MIWLDQVEYGEEQEMPYISSLDKDSVVFENIFSVTPYTDPTVAVLFSKKRVIEEESYKINDINKLNSSFIKELEKEGYQFVYYGITPYFSGEYMGSLYVTNYSVITEMFWHNIIDNLDSDKKVFSVIHSITHTHDPFVSFGLIGGGRLYQLGRMARTMARTK